MKARTVVVVDTREQEPYTFDPARVEVIRRALPAGDYSLLGLENSVAVERKSIEDFVGTVIRGRERFARELARLRECEFACVVVECSLTDILSGRYRSDAHSIIVDYGVPVFFCGSRQAARLFVEQLLLKLCEKVDAPCQHQQEPQQA